MAAVLSYYAAGMTTTFWLPSDHSPLDDGVRAGTRQLVFAGFVNQWQEFWPSIRRYLHRRFWPAAAESELRRKLALSTRGQGGQLARHE